MRGTKGNLIDPVENRNEESEYKVRQIRGKKNDVEEKNPTLHWMEV